MNWVGRTWNTVQPRPRVSLCEVSLHRLRSFNAAAARFVAGCRSRMQRRFCSITGLGLAVNNPIFPATWQLFGSNSQRYADWWAWNTVVKLPR
jgi:hypothetical protein